MIKRHEIAGDEDAYDKNGILKDGHIVRVPMYAMDGTQRAVAQSRASFVDSMGNPAGNRPGFIIDTSTQDEKTLRYNIEKRDFEKAQLAARYRGGLQVGDPVRLGDRRMVVTGFDADNGKPILADETDENPDDAKQLAYDSYASDLTNAWQNSRTLDAADEGDACTVNGARGVWKRRKDGKLVCAVSNEEREWAVAGPLSDAEMRDAKEQAYRDYESEICSNWQRNK